MDGRRYRSFGDCIERLGGMTLDATSILLSALFAGIVATAVTVAIEKWGGLVGGLLGTVPSTIVPAGIGMYVAGGEEVLVVSMSVVPLGMLLNALFLGARWSFLAGSPTHPTCWC